MKKIRLEKSFWITVKIIPTNAPEPEAGSSGRPQNYMGNSRSLRIPVPMNLKIPSSTKNIEDISNCGNRQKGSFYKAQIIL